MQVYFNHNQAAEYEEPYRQRRRSGDDLEQIIADSIAAATTRIDVAVQEFRLPKIAAALAERHQAGVTVRVIVENTYSRPWSELTAAEVGEMDARMRSSYDEFILLADINGDGTLSPEEINGRDALVMLRNAGVPVIDDTADGSKGSGLMHPSLSLLMAIQRLSLRPISPPVIFTGTLTLLIPSVMPIIC
ncbi:MAG: hypothetical protein Fur0025_43320 [Oscillatoriaceae cyanobacterium]